MQIFMASEVYSMGPPILPYFLWYVPGGHQSYHAMSTIIAFIACITGLWLLYFLLDNPWGGAGQPKKERKTRKATLLLPCAMHLVIIGRDPAVLASSKGLGGGRGGKNETSNEFFSRAHPCRLATMANASGTSVKV